MSVRPALEPEWQRTVHCVGDLHAGAITDFRLKAVAGDVQALSAPALHLQIGDTTEEGRPAEDRLAVRFLDGLPGPWTAVLGNHDIMRNARSVQDWARAYGHPSQNFTIELEFARLIVVGPNRNEPGKRAGRLSAATLSFLDRELGRRDKDCWVACHWPLFRTVMGDPKRHFTSAMSAFHATPDERIRVVLARHPNAKLWLSGHTHSPLSAPGLIRRAKLAAKRSIVAINGSALVGVGKRRDPRDPLCSLFLTHQPGRIEVRCRDHRAGVWRNVRGRRIVTVAV
jgi:3',5'-cyclic AMP phosphodiesterase CpdA